MRATRRLWVLTWMISIFANSFSWADDWEGLYLSRNPRTVIGTGSDSGVRISKVHDGNFQVHEISVGVGRVGSLDGAMIVSRTCAETGPYSLTLGKESLTFKNYTKQRVQLRAFQDGNSKALRVDRTPCKMKCESEVYYRQVQKDFCFHAH